MDSIPQSPSPENLGNRLKRLRKQTHLTAKEVAHRLGVATSTYREWEMGRAIRGEPYPALCEVLNVSLHELLLGERSPDQQTIMSEIDAIEARLQALRRLVRENI